MSASPHTPTAPAEDRRGSTAANIRAFEPKTSDSAAGLTLELPLPADFVEVVAERVAALLAQQPVSPYMTVDEAADYLRCSRQRIYDLLSSRRLTRLKDGSRVLLLRSELDAHLAGVAPSLPPSPLYRMDRGRAA
jgi:excisionase family DNA binding protein